MTVCSNCGTETDQRRCPEMRCMPKLLRLNQLPHEIRCQNPACAKIIRPQSHAVLSTLTIGRTNYCMRFCSPECMDVIERRKLGLNPDFTKHEDEENEEERRN